MFFDLVFAFAFTQVTQLMPPASGALRGLVVMALLWWAWSSATPTSAAYRPDPSWNAKLVVTQWTELAIAGHFPAVEDPANSATDLRHFAQALSGNRFVHL